MELLTFHRYRSAIQGNAFPGDAEAVRALAEVLQTTLRNSGLFESVEVEATDDPDQLVIALCQFRADFDEADVVEYLETAWDDRIRYPFWEAHTLIWEPEHIEIEAATRESIVGHYVTLHLVAQKATIPAQRQPED